MEFLARKLPLIAALVAIVGVSVGSMALSQTPSYGAETDVDVDVVSTAVPQVVATPTVCRLQRLWIQGMTVTAELWAPTPTRYLRPVTVAT
jgi:hypothetical protein